MRKTNTIIELNGKHYDAHTGRLLHSKDSGETKPAASHTPKKGTNMDGFVRAKPRTSSTARRQPTVAQRKREHSKTLMRHVVQKPKAAQKTPTAAHSATKTTALPAITTPADLFALRDKRAFSIKKSPLISRFGEPAHAAPVNKKYAPLAVTPAPEHKKVATHKHPARTHTSHSDHIAKALTNASSHKANKIRKKRIHHRVAKKLGISATAVSVSAAALAFVMLGGFYAYQNVPNIAMRVAASKAGFNASMPGYVPSGFAMNGKIQAASGRITVSFSSRTDNRNFQLIQEPSDWNSKSLLDNYVASASKNYQSVESKGNTIYIYDGSNATWVNQGIWYQIHGSSDLNSQQLLNIASSM